MRIDYFLLPIITVFFSFQTIFSQSIDDKIEKALDDHLMDARGKISEEEGVFSLFYFDVFEKDSHAKYLQDKGYHGGGPSWLAITYAAFNIFEPNIIDSVQYELDTSGITFKTGNREDLQMISRVIALIKSDETILNEMINRAKALEIMK